MTVEVSAPQPLLDRHNCADFDCGERSLDDWLRRRALANQASGASRTFVVVDGQQRVMGYYALAVGAISHHEATGAIRRNMPEQIPVMVLGRLAADRRVQGQKLGGVLLQDAVLRALRVSESAGVRAVLVHALNDGAKRFYEHYGFAASPVHPMTLMLRLGQGMR
ncbi:MAG TPA: GNAT family N-acetyltransferase [Solimonas sp.]|nr:GNAT family N-acetyltransferase [Solimonas sp.]